jgi:predicted metal-dependent enzyme (double-stranded beta helix superfamily)
MFDVDDFVADCRTALSEAQPVLAVKEIVERAVSDPAAVDDALGTASSGGFRTLHSSDDLTVLQFVWPPKVVLFPHDHRMWAANGIYRGSEDNTFFRRAEGGLEVSGGTELESGTVAVLGQEVIHSVANPRSSYTAAIHVYGGDFFGTPRSQWDPDSGDEERFDVEAVRRLLAAADEEANRSQN